MTKEELYKEAEDMGFIGFKETCQENNLDVDEISDIIKAVKEANKFIDTEYEVSHIKKCKQYFIDHPDADIVPDDFDPPPKRD